MRSHSLQFSGLGAGIDSYYEYLLKSHVLFGNSSSDEDEDGGEDEGEDSSASDGASMFSELYSRVLTHMRKGRSACNSGEGLHPIFVSRKRLLAKKLNPRDLFPQVNVDMRNGETANHWIDSLQAAFPGVQVLHGDLDEAVCHHALYYALWLRYGALPERYNWKLDAPDV